MELYELVWRRLSEDADVVLGLTAFQGMPAIFTEEAASDEAEGWAGCSHYPRIVFYVDLSANEERRCQGTMVLTLYAENNGRYDFERAMNAVSRCLCNVFLTPDGGSPYCLAWSRSDGFSLDGTNICGQEMQFDLLEYPSQETTDPDPAAALNEYLKVLFPEALVLWRDAARREEAVECGRPVFYCRMERDAEEDSRSTFSVTWMECSIAIHIFCLSGSLRNQYARSVSARLSADKEFCMLDGSPFLVTASSFSPGADFLRTGQVMVSGRYGILRHTEKKRRILSMEKEWKGLKMDDMKNTAEMAERAAAEGTEGDMEEVFYSVDELAAASRKRFGCSNEMVRAAFLSAGRRRATLKEAAELIWKFRNQEVL